MNCNTMTSENIVSASATPTVKIKLLRTTAGSKMFYDVNIRREVDAKTSYNVYIRHEVAPQNFAWSRIKGSIKNFRY